MFSEVAKIALVTARLGQFQQLLKTRVILILNFTLPHAITYTDLLILHTVTTVSHSTLFCTLVNRVLNCSNLNAVKADK